MKTLNIGRAVSNDVVIQDSFVSGNHCSITLDEKGNFYLQDLGSSNGTYVNGKRVQQAWLRSNDIVRIGETIIPWQEYFQTQSPDQFSGQVIRKVTLGRAADNDIVIGDDFVSSHHAEILQTDQHEFLVNDLNSTNGTFVNDRRVISALLHPGDSLRLARRTLEWTMFFSTPSLRESRSQRKPVMTEEATSRRPKLSRWAIVFIVAGAVLIAFLIAWGVTSWNPDPASEGITTPNDTTLADASFTDVVRRVEKSVFLIESYDRYGNSMQGTGFFISADGRGVTNYHVVEGGTKWDIKTIDGDIYHIDDFIVRNKQYDYAVFTIDAGNQTFPWLKRSAEAPSKGEEIFVLGNPQGIESTLTKGIVSGFKGGDENDIMNGRFTDGDNFIQVDVAVSHGSSGSPVMNLKGEVVGIATLSFQHADCINCNFALNIQLLKQYLESTR